MYNLGEVKTIIAVEYHDVERIIEKEYAFKEFSIPCNHEMGNDVTLEIGVDGKVDKYDEKDLVERKVMWRTGLYMNDLARRGLIKKGIYMINISW